MSDQAAIPAISDKATSMFDVPSPFEFTKTFHKVPYPAIDPSRPEVSAAGKILFVTGGGTGIGRAIIEAFATAGAAQVILIGRRQNIIEGTAAELSKAFPGTKFHGFPGSVSDQDGITKLFETVRETIGEPNILVTSAADQPGNVKVLEMPHERIIEAFNTNVFGNLNVVRQFCKGLTPESKTDKIILEVSSSAVHRCYKGASIYTSSKTAFMRLTQQVQGEFWNTGLRVHSFHPGTIASEMTRKGGMSATDDRYQRMWDDVNLPGHFAVWVASPEAEFLKGRFLWAHWDVEELKAKKQEIEGSKMMIKLGLVV
ncbi:hypothetical protein MMC08_007036 [Hypocenomyce scalaris]|nr:hypothetical protein [Hypocenomyce scalaris]